MPVRTENGILAVTHRSSNDSVRDSGDDADVITSVFIVGISLLLFLYWFRYTCSLILSTGLEKDYRREVAEANQLHFLEIERDLDATVDEPLDAMKQCLDKDYRLVTFLQRQTAGGGGEGAILEQVMLRANFRLLSLGYRLSRRLRPNLARRALEEMTRIIGHFANSFGAQAAGVAI